MDKKTLLVKVQKYRKITKDALAKVLVKKGLSAKDKKTAADFLQVCKNYFSDSDYFEKKGELENALASLSYAHAWLDAGVRARLFDAKGDSRLFTLP
ncbi:MAG: DUF357 domain-containing protein [Candidatus Diapherotrites archaeon]|nr:DUF357 domain-containing protein [Candidatus Diapherotrites archaeon]